MTDLNEYRERKDATAWGRRLVTDVNALTQRIIDADKRGVALPSDASRQIAVSLTIAWRSVVRMEMRGLGGR